MLSIIEGGDDALDRAYETLKADTAGHKYALTDVRLLSPIPRPPQMRDCLCFELHLVQAFNAARQLKASRSPDPAAALAEMERTGELRVPATFYDQPIYYKCNRFAVIGTDEDVIWPSYSQVLDFELEFGCFIGKPAKDIAARQGARLHFRLHHLQRFHRPRRADDRRWAACSVRPRARISTPAMRMGPCLVTADELKDPYDLTMIARVNGEEWGRGNIAIDALELRGSDRTWISRSETLYPGEFLGSGTVGNGCGLEQMRFLKPDDIVELEVEGIGILRNTIRRTA